jgi:maltooligosyltrehalose trehalohydrolase
MKRRHLMPFGAELHQGTARFRLWAPAATNVRLDLREPDGARQITMSRRGRGWFAAVAEHVTCGSRYSFRIDDRISVPDPASRYNPEDVHHDSALTCPEDFEWSDDRWRGRPWATAIVYELHIGTFSGEGTFAGAIAHLDYLVDLGVTAIELMPVADFPGQRNWGYDGVLLFAPDASYGSPDDLKRLVVAAHERGLMVILDVVYNHFGPEGNYLHEYAPQFFNTAAKTPWGAAINFDGPQSQTVREFFVHNALYWIEEFNVDGLRLDAVHAILDSSTPDFIAELAEAVRNGPGRERHVHLIVENDNNRALDLKRDRAGRPLGATAQWNDDVHHALHVLLTGETDGYYRDYAQRPLWLLGRCLTEGFGYQGEPSTHRGGKARGEPSALLPYEAFVSFLQCHDQVGNRPFGDRISALAEPAPLRLALRCLLLSPQIPMLFMGEEFAASSPFLFFCDFGPPLDAAVREGRRREFAAFDQFHEHAAGEGLPDPTAYDTFARSKLRWNELDQPEHRSWHAFYRALLQLRREHIVPHLQGAERGAAFFVQAGVLGVDWTLPDGARLHLRANFSSTDANQALIEGQSILPGAPEPRASLAAWDARMTIESSDG